MHLSNMPGPLLFWLLNFTTFFTHLLCSDSSANKEFVRTKTDAYDELYNDGLYAYNLKNFSAAAKYFELAIADYRHQGEVKVQCRSKCLLKFRKSLVNRNVRGVLQDLELEYFRLTIYSRKCTQICREKYLGKRSAVSARIDEDFRYRMPYSYLQFAYYKMGQVIKAARAAVTYLETSPNEEFMLKNLRFYKQMPLIANDLLVSYEPVVHQSLYFKAVKLYEEQKWEMAIEQFEEAIKEYLKAYERCTLNCEELREANKILGRSGLYGVYLDVLSCRSHCPLTLSNIKGKSVDYYFARHFNYLQMSYYKADKIKQAAECATTYLLLDPDDANMFDNLKYFRFWLSEVNVGGNQIEARQEIIDYHREIVLSSKLLNLALVYTAQDKEEMSDELFDDSDEPDEDEEHKGKAEDLVEGEAPDYSSIKLSGLGPLREASEIKPVEKLIESGKYKGVELTMKEEALNGTNRFVADNFLSEDQCKTLMDLARKTAKLGDGYTERATSDGKPFSFTEKETFEGVTPMAAVKSINEGKTDLGPVELYINASDRMRDFVEDYFQMETPLYFSYSHLVCRASKPDTKDKAHISHPIHADNCLLHQDGPETCPKRSPAFTWRDYSALLYLNGDFDGGEFIFTHRNETIQAKVKPKCGRMVGFSAGVENLHGVLGVEGRRCAVAIWFTLRTKHDEKARHEAKKVLEEIRRKLVFKDHLKQRFAEL